MIKLWIIEGELISTLKGHSGDIKEVMFSHDSQNIVSASRDNTVKLWSLTTDDLISQGCQWIKDYLSNSPIVNQDDRNLCDGIR